MSTHDHLDVEVQDSFAQDIFAEHKLKMEKDMDKKNCEIKVNGISKTHRTSPSVWTPAKRIEIRIRPETSSKLLKLSEKRREENKNKTYQSKSISNELSGGSKKGRLMRFSCSMEFSRGESPPCIPESEGWKELQKKSQ